MLRAPLTIFALAVLPACSGSVRVPPGEVPRALGNPAGGVVDVDGERREIPSHFTLEIVPNEHGGHAPALNIANTVQHPLTDDLSIEKPTFAAVAQGALIVRSGSDPVNYAVPLGEIRHVELSWGKAERNAGIVTGSVAGGVVVIAVLYLLVSAGSWGPTR